MNETCARLIKNHHGSGRFTESGGSLIGRRRNGITRPKWAAVHQALAALRMFEVLLRLYAMAVRRTCSVAFARPRHRILRSP